MIEKVCDELIHVPHAAALGLVCPIRLVWLADEHRLDSAIFRVKSNAPAPSLNLRPQRPRWRGALGLRRHWTATLRRRPQLGATWSLRPRLGATWSLRPQLGATEALEFGFHERAEDLEWHGGARAANKGEWPVALIAHNVHLAPSARR